MEKAKGLYWYKVQSDLMENVNTNQSEFWKSIGRVVIVTNKNIPMEVALDDGICNNDYGVNIGQVTSSRLCRRCTNLRILSGISGVSRNKQNESKISILGSQKSKKVTKILHSHQWNLYELYSVYHVIASWVFHFRFPKIPNAIFIPRMWTISGIPVSHTVKI